MVDPPDGAEDQGVKALSALVTIKRNMSRCHLLGLLCWMGVDPPPG